MSSTTTRRCILGLAWAMMLAAGCSQPGRVSGLVTLDGEPLTTGVITFNPAASGPSAYGAIGSDGRYELKTGATSGLQPGEYVVTVAANSAPPEGGEDQRWPGPQRSLPLVTPKKYADRERTPLRALVRSGQQALDFELLSE